MKKTIIWIIGFMLFYGTSNAQSPTDTYLDIYQIKVSKGHATLVVIRKISDENHIHASFLIDAGNDQSDGNIIEQVINSKANGKLDAVFVTHHDQDHWGGLAFSNGLLAKRCKSTVTGSLNKKNPAKLKLYYNHQEAGTTNDNDPRLSNWSTTKIMQYAGDRVELINWKNNTPDIPLLPSDDGSSPMWFKTLAVNGYLKGDNTADKRLQLGGFTRKNGQDVPTAFFKNNASGVALITWGNFSFLVQGDMEAAFAGKKYTKQERNITVNTQGEAFVIKQSSTSGKGKNLENIINGSQNDWNQVTASNGKVRTNLYYNIGDGSNELDEDSDAYVLRMNKATNSGATVSSSSRKRKRIEDVVTTLSEDNWVAAPSEWFHRLGKKIDDANGFGKYAHSCIAVVPHHGGLTSNLWFDTDHAIIGSNKSNEHFHPRHESVIALYNSVRPRYNYITYLLDNPAVYNKNSKHISGGSMNSNLYATYVNGILPNDNTFKTFYLDGKGTNATSTQRNTLALKGPVGSENGTASFFHFRVKQTSESNTEKQIRVRTDNSSFDSSFGTWEACSRGHL